MMGNSPAILLHVISACDEQEAPWRNLGLPMAPEADWQHRHGKLTTHAIFELPKPEERRIYFTPQPSCHLPDRPNQMPGQQPGSIKRRCQSRSYLGTKTILDHVSSRPQGLCIETTAD